MKPSLTADLNRWCYSVPTSENKYRWVGHQSSELSVWKFGASLTASDLYVFVMTARKEKEITEFLNNNIHIKI